MFLPRLIGLRAAIHRELAADRIQEWQPYEHMDRSLIPNDTVTARRDLGIPSYYLPGLTTIDVHGLTDATVARTPVTRPNDQRAMAHDRCAPPGYIQARGVNFYAFPPVSNAAEAIEGAEYVVQIGPNVWMPFSAAERSWVSDRFPAFSDIDSVTSPTVPAVFIGDSTPVVGEVFTSRLSDETWEAGFTDRGLWAWERSSGAAGSSWELRWSWVLPWTWTTYCAVETYQYTPAPEDVGHRLRAFVYFTDAEGHRVKAVTPASDPVVSSMAEREAP